MSLPIITGEFGVGSVEAKFSQKGNLWVSARIVAKDRVRDANGVWGDGDPCWLSLVVFGQQAENLAESVEKGDTITVTGKLGMREWTTDGGEKRTMYQITVDQFVGSVGVSVKWNPVKAVKADRGATERAVSNLADAGMTQAPQTEEPPF